MAWGLRLPTTTVKRIRRLLPVLFLLVWMGLILFLSSRSSLPNYLLHMHWIGQYQDELGHLGEYAVLGMLTFVVIRPRMSGRRTFMFGLAFCTLFSLVDEAFQGIITNRTSQFIDVLLDTVGAVAGIATRSVLGSRLNAH